jgi:Fur family ferric uptake transcriptional regulator
MTERPATTTTAAAHGAATRTLSWDDAREVLHERGLRWTPQRRLILEVLAATRGHVTGSEVVERCRARDPEITPSTVYRTLDVLEDVGYLHHSHGADGREEYHVMPTNEHGHLRCLGCGGSWEIPPAEAMELLATLRHARGFSVDLSHLTIIGRCASCREATQG